MPFACRMGGRKQDLRTLGEFSRTWYPIVMKRHRVSEPATYDFEELAIWRTKLPNANHAVLPPQNNRPNPLVSESVVYASVFSEGAICVLERKSGKLLWRKEIPKLAGSAVYLAQGKLFAKTAQTLYALEPKTGKTIWSFCPYGESGESIYSDPTVYDGRLFIGDRSGFLHCLDSRTGQTLWRARANTAKNRDVNSTPIVVGGLVIVATNANLAVAYDVKTGSRAWLRPLDGPSTFGPLLFRGMLVAITRSIYFLKPESGKLIRRFSWKEDGVSEADCTQRDVVCLLRGSWPPEGTSRLVGLNVAGIRFAQSSTAYVALIHFVRATKLIYISHLQGIDVRRPTDGGLVCKVKRETSSSGIGPVDVSGRRIYALTGDGYAYALRHPVV
jgi:outer membrane protein assembly factor BamB